MAPILQSICGFLFRSLVIVCFSGIFTSGYAQFSQFSGLSLKFPWAGGLNSCQFCAIDLNNDGIKDLLIFDRHGNRKLTFINHGTPNAIDYTFAPDFALQLPDLHDWVITADYNSDGRQDIFTYGMGGVRVFENISDTSLKFKLITDLLESYYYTGKVGILVTDVDYPALSDIDNDGDLDLLTFFGLGSYVEYHKNISMEKYGHRDSLDFKLADPCWGKFKESEGGNRITLNAGCPLAADQISNFKFQISDFKLQIANCKLQNTKSRHTGSTLLAIDLNNDGLKDLILGDVDYPGLVALYNGGTHDSAFIVAQDTTFPATSKLVDLFSFPAVSNIDIDNDGLNDLLVSPFDPALFTSDNYNCVWFYKNTGSNVQPVFEFQTEDLFRSEMMDFGSASHPVLYDFDGDGLEDLFAGDNGTYDSSYYQDAQLHSVYTSKIAFFRNTGTKSRPLFTSLTSDLAGISGMGLRGAYPTFGDLNGDSHPDMLVGNSDGTLILFINSGIDSVVPQFETPLRHWQGIDVGNYSAPQLFDLDKDNIPDLIIGEPAENPSFKMVTDSLGKVNVTNYNLSYNGYSAPCFSRKPDGTTFLIAGSDEGRIHYFENIDNNLNGKFKEAGGLYNWISSTPADTLFGWQTSPTIGHLTDPVDFDMITGNFAGGLNYISKRSPVGISESHPVQPCSMKVYPNPADRMVTIHLDEKNQKQMAGSIANLYGQKVIEFQHFKTTTLPVAKLPSGTYVIHLGEVTANLIVIHP
ncbi:MAG: FG-GAP-like repeat-containing protein [Bacteroidetes bacterium]|nr:FG-GAP-like repeat-containing protein [Bacteroidota bacterium]